MKKKVKPSLISAQTIVLIERIQIELDKHQQPKNKKRSTADVQS